MIVAARKLDLEKAEFAAFNLHQNKSFLRRWEQPFALFNMHLTGSEDILDVSLNPEGFAERQSLLYPQVRYLHSPPTVDGRFDLSRLPDTSFDRIICINTLEHLLRPQRQVLLNRLAERLRPGGILVVTTEFYDQSVWDNPDFQAAKLVRADRKEIFNGFNQVTPSELARNMQKSGLEPWNSKQEQLSPHGYEYLISPPPYSCGVHGAVFYKAPRPVFPAKRILLALLSWNCGHITLESVQAYQREAQLLQRLGHDPAICVVDNGSTDGTAEQLSRLMTTLDVDNRLILNPINLGNCLGRNQIIDYAIQRSADYVLFLDGDIEVVPFSSVAMLRYLEDEPSSIGSLGAYSFTTAGIRGQETPCHFSVRSEPRTRSNIVSSSGYGMYRGEVFNNGVRFDTSEAFTGPGWGFEDNDFAFQMLEKGYEVQHFYGMTFLHRDVQSSVRIMKSQGIDANLACERRRQHLLKKWSTIPKISNGPLKTIGQMKFSL